MKELRMPSAFLFENGKKLLTLISNQACSKIKSIVLGTEGNPE